MNTHEYMILMSRLCMYVCVYMYLFTFVFKDMKYVFMILMSRLLIDVYAYKCLRHNMICHNYLLCIIIFLLSYSSYLEHPLIYSRIFS